MKRWLVPLAALSAVAGAVVLALFLAGVFDGDDASGSDGAGSEVAGVCAEDHPDCEDTLVAPDASDEDGGAGETSAPVCAPDYPDCDDMIVTDVGGDDLDGAEPPPVDPMAPIEGLCSSEALAELQDSCLAATQGASTDLQRRLGVDDVEIVVEDVEYAEWPDSCLAAAQEGEACATAITPGFVVVLGTGGEQFEYHTDLNGGVRLAQ